MLRETRERLDKLSHQLELIETVLIVREPGSVKSADAYEGLRRQVVAAVGERQSHLAHLAQLDVALERGESVESLRLLIKDLLNQANLVRVSDPGVADAFEVVSGSGDHLVVLEPAYVDGSTGRIVRQGRAKATSTGVLSTNSLNADIEVAR